MPEPAGDQQQVAAARVHLERAPERPEQVDRVARPQPREPVRPPPDHPEMDGHDAGGGIGRVERERPAQDHPGEVARAGRGRTGRPASRSPGPARDTPAATGPAGSPDSRPAPRRRAASSRGRFVLGVVVGVGGLGAGFGRVPGGLAASPVPFGSTRPASSGRDGREGLREGVGQVAEHVGRVVELDQLVGAARASATRPRSPRG